MTCEFWILTILWCEGRLCRHELRKRTRGAFCAEENSEGGTDLKVWSSNREPRERDSGLPRQREGVTQENLSKSYGSSFSDGGIYTSQSVHSLALNSHFNLWGEKCLMQLQPGVLSALVAEKNQRAKLYHCRVCGEARSHPRRCAKCNVVLWSFKMLKYGGKLGILKAHPKSFTTKIMRKILDYKNSIWQIIPPAGNTKSRKGSLWKVMSERYLYCYVYWITVKIAKTQTRLRYLSINE